MTPNIDLASLGTWFKGSVSELKRWQFAVLAIVVLGSAWATYSIYANSISDRTRHVDATHAFLSGSSVFLFSERLRKEPVSVELAMPEDWGIATGLEPLEGRERTLQAADYDVLVDSPIEVGLHEVLSFEHEGVPHEIVEVFERHGFIWGGKWYHYDTMHFEYRPELLATAVRRDEGC